MELISRSHKQYKANLHCHSILSDGNKTPEELKAMYRDAGYQILAITDHEFPKDHSSLSEENFLMLTGYEGYIRPSAIGKYDAYSPEVHLNLFAKESSNEAFVCFNECYAKYLLRRCRIDDFRCVGSSEPRRYDRAYIQEYINTARQNGYLVAYNHPYWSMQDESEILSYEGLFSLEIRNAGSWICNGLEYAAPLYDKLLSLGRPLFCHAGDDNHNKAPLDVPGNDSFLTWTYICAEDLQYGSVIHAMEQGNMYASSGPQIYSLTYEDNGFHIETSPATQICMYTGSKSPQIHRAACGECLTSANFTIDPRARYYRFTVFDEKGNTADTRGFFSNELR